LCSPSGDGSRERLGSANDNGMKHSRLPVDNDRGRNL